MLKELLNNSVVYKTFILEEEYTQFSQVVVFPVDITSQYLNMEELFINKIPNYRNYTIRLYDFSINHYVVLESIAFSEYKVPMTFILACNSVVLVKYKKRQSETGSSVRETISECEEKHHMSETSSLKKQRAKQRMISEVIQIVKRWRDLHIQKRGQKKISLQEAAKMLGLPKKSLDDYYYQLRLGEKYGFDFKKNFFQRIGYLRNFLKDKRPRLKSEHSDKHPKNLKVIEQFEQIRRNSSGTKIEEEPAYEQLEDRNNNSDQMMFDQYGEYEQLKLENQFYQDFGFLDERQEPFISLDGNFKKKKTEKLFDQQLFF